MIDGWNKFSVIHNFFTECINRDAKNKFQSTHTFSLRFILSFLTSSLKAVPDSKVYGAYMGPSWGRQDPDGPHVGPMILAIWGVMALMQLATYHRQHIKILLGFGW